MLSYKVKIEGKSPLMLAKNSGILKMPENLSDEQRAEVFCYRNKKGNLAVPVTNMKGSLRGGYTYGIGRGSEDMVLEFEQDVNIETVDEDDPVYLDLKKSKYDEIFKRSVLIGKDKRGRFKAADMAVNPLLTEWDLTFVINCGLLGVTEKDLRKIIETTGNRIGLCGFRKGGYGRFKIVEFEQLTET
jgi:hypothetical protein